MRIDQNLYLVVFECCQVVKGAKLALIHDLQRKMQRQIPNEFADLLLNYNGTLIKELLSNYKADFHEIILENLQLLIDEEYCFLTKHPEKFPKMSMDWHTSSAITNAIVEYNSVLDFKSIIQQLSDLGCEHLELRFYKQITFEDLSRTLSLLDGSRILSLVLHIPFQEEVSLLELEMLISDYPRIAIISQHTAPENKDVSAGKKGFGIIKMTTQAMSSNIHCGKFNLDLLNVNIKSFTEAKQFNSCLNRKISVDQKGQIKNCPSMMESYGNIDEISLAQVIENPDFLKYWDINKDKIHVCKDCEYRFMCHDCRAYVENPEDIFSKPLKCGYNPYAGEWTEWSNNPLKKTAIEYYGMQELMGEISEVQV